MAVRVLLLALALAACGPGDRAPEPAPEAAPTAPGTPAAPLPPADVGTDGGGEDPAQPYDGSTVVFDPSEPPETVTQIPPRPAPPTPRPSTPPPPPAPEPLGPSGSCDVRSTEGYCFAFTGETWTPSAARSQCAAAPEASYAPATCPLDGRVATCTFERPSQPGREIVYTYYAPYDPRLAELACPGTFARVE
ncbi:hypothetical protein [Rubrivirga sp. IMCC45206]|uniref:hypothetical protein n=1 Tax=Rubrivirga sp. IMCC45206 TaxID=3391614 RepID=UPI0039903A25